MATEDQLSLHLIRDVVGLEEGAEREERRTGAGSYGYVFQVSVGGVQRIAKKLHSSFVNPSQVSVHERESITSRFRNECVILSKLRHPNIVQFIGVHYGRRGKADLTLIMECVSSDMDKFLEVHPNIPLPLKLSILLDISYGLVYLHECNPPIVHRDLTARNILINDKCQAKIADLGMAKIVDIQAQLAASHTQNPGNTLYMPPEALKEKALCTPKLDIFSFGHLTLYTVNQEFPKVYNITLTMAIQTQGIIERLKRQTALDRVGKDHCLYPVITNCLYDNPEYRPNTRALNRKLVYLSSQDPAGMESVLQVMGSGASQAAETELRELREKILVLEQDKDAVMKDLLNSQQVAKNISSKCEQQAVELSQLKQSKEELCGELEAHKLMMQEKLDYHLMEISGFRDAHAIQKSQIEKMGAAAEKMANQIDLLKKEVTNLKGENTDLKAGEKRLSAASVRSDGGSNTVSVTGKKQILYESFEESQLQTATERQVGNPQKQAVAPSSQPVLEQDFFYVVMRTDVVMKERLGSGAWGVVSAGEYRGCKVAVKAAIKEVNEPLAYQIAVKHMRHEANTMSRMHHPNIVTFIGAIFDDGGLPLIIMERMEANLQAVYKSALTKDQILRIFMDVAYALDYLHEFKEPIIHRDVSATNVFLNSLPDKKYVAKVSGFWSASLAKDARGEIGSAPECCLPDARLTVKVDSYSYGMLLCEVINRKLGKRDAGVEAVAKKWNNMRSLVFRCTERDPASRPTMAGVLDYLKHEMR